MPGIPGVVPSIVIPIVGVAQAEAAISCQSGRISEVSVVKAIVVTIGIAFIVTFTLGGCSGNVERVALQLIGRSAVRQGVVATIVFIYVTQISSVVIGI